MIRKGRKRPLKDEERALWEHVIRSVAPLRPKRKVAALPPPLVPEALPENALPPDEVLAAKAPAKTATVKPAIARKAMVPVVPAPPPLSRIEPKVRRKLNRGADADARLDLHGLTQAAAHRRLHLFIVEAQAQGHSLVLIITGKGGQEEAFGASFTHGLDGGRGVLRRAVPQWLTDPMLRPYVVGFENAARHHGGDGALYVRIRRRRSGRD
ncbi:DNA mismatch repair protein MutS [Azorhizobium oxalatiphilum]|uniref:DNA mismatch repair protein MutS n=1 Tax=Azorhizobium oxalatiphilum TaxID=980631 RepID=A0A917C8X2_9HYPH|nr:Smr/MutS family protein [Azorhizobium oxalatiphilum]GGF76342.1 DNA mismatch repair protein MutS [Azorhizobium oxalatiphilum]